MLRVRRMIGTGSSNSGSKLIRFNPDEFTARHTDKTPIGTMASLNDSDNVMLVTNRPNFELRGTGGLQNPGYHDDGADRLSLQQQETSLTITPPTSIACSVCSKSLSNGELIGGGNNLPYLRSVCEECYDASSDGLGADNESNDSKVSPSNELEFIQEFALNKSDSEDEDGNSNSDNADNGPADVADTDSLSENFFTSNSQEMEQAPDDVDVSSIASSTGIESVKEPEPPRPIASSVDKIRLPRVIICAGCEEGHKAIKLCNECGYICDECVDAHMKFRQLQRHTVSVVDALQKPKTLQQNAVDNNNGEQSPREPVMPQRHQCDTHSDFELVLYCKSPQCQKPICAICTLEIHDKLQGHVHVKLQDAVDEAMTQIKKTTTFLTDKKDLAMTVKCKVEKAKNALAEQHKDKLKELNEAVKELHDCIDGHHSAAASKLEHLYNNETQRLDDNSISIQSVSDQINTACELVKGASGVSDSVEVLETRDKIKENLKVLQSVDITDEILTPRLFPFSTEHHSTVDTLKNSLSRLFDINETGKEQESSSEMLSAPGEHNEMKEINNNITPPAVSANIDLEGQDIPTTEQADTPRQRDDLKADDQVASLQEHSDQDKHVATLRKLSEDDVFQLDGSNAQHDEQFQVSSQTSSQTSSHSELARSNLTDSEDTTAGGDHVPSVDEVKSAALIHNDSSTQQDLPVTGGIAALYELNGEFQPKESESSALEHNNKDKPQRSSSRSSLSSITGSTHSGRQSDNSSVDIIADSINPNATDIKSASIVSRDSSTEFPEELPVIGGIAALWELNGDFQPKETVQSPPASRRQQQRGGDGHRRRRSSSRHSVSSASGSTHSGLSRHSCSETSSEVMFSDGGSTSSGIVKSADLINDDSTMESPFTGGIAALYELNGNYKPEEFQHRQTESPPQSPEQPLRRSSRSSSIGSDISAKSGFSRSRSSSRSSRGSFHSESSRGSSRSLEPSINNTRNTYSALTGSPETGVRCITMSSLSTSPPVTSGLSKRSNQKDRTPKSSKPVKIDPRLCIAVLDKNLRLRKPCSTKVRTFNTLGDPIQTGGADIRVLLEYDDAGWQIADGKVVILDHLDGSYTVKFTPCWYGNHRLAISINGIPIQDSPFMFWVPYCM